MSKGRSPRELISLDAGLSLAISACDFDAADEALKLGAKFGPEELLRAAMEGHSAKVAYLLGRGAPGEPDPGSLTNLALRTPLHEAIQNGHVECALLLARRRPADAMVADANGMTPLFYAAVFGPLEATQALVGISDFAALDRNGRTALDLAADPASKSYLEAYELACEERRRLSDASAEASQTQGKRI